MSTVILKGREAIHYAEVHGLTLNEFEDDSHGPRTGLSIQEAWDIFDAGSGHVWVEVNVAVNSAEPKAH